jgi:hypothetical protein
MYAHHHFNVADASIPGRTYAEDPDRDPSSLRPAERSYALVAVIR